MPTFRVTVELTQVDALDSTSLRASLDQTLRDAGFKGWRVVTVVDESQAREPRPMRPAPRRRDGRGGNIGLLLIGGAALWALWFFWMLMSE